MNRTQVPEEVLRVIKKRLAAGEELTPGQQRVVERLRKAAKADYKPAQVVAKISLRQGEELGSFMDALHQAVQRDRILLGDGSFDIYLAAVYEDKLVVQDWNTGKFLRATYTRAADGSFTFGTPEEVRQMFVSATEAESLTTKAAPMTVAHIRVER